ncbi:binding-protein-dependent transport system inner membrane component [Rhodopirellula maiorica SM1]|uniref:Binding-protein-dependent transport system inner membrane component n=1 Tax=Rhodopirellula maiorica SM1 TaxID=1265738 RepID=M5RSU2_9BACT|nr:ABC transporter permease [Rhodopirellula maiorica]EMI18457.1 binding-protein-dependent transport system inner membrane component [Rhodopirellula maiorica SM1]
MNSPAWKSVVLSVASVVAGALVLLTMWTGVIWYFELPPILLPSPNQVLSTAMQERKSLLRGTYVTGLAATVGLVSAVVIGCVISIAFSQSRSIRKAFFPYVVFLQTVPIVAIAPLLITWSGYQFRTVVIVTVIVCLFPIVNSVTEGLLAIQTDLNDMFRLYGASRTQRLLKLQLPTAVPYLMLGTKTSSGLAVIGAIVAEFFVGNGSNYDGLGTLMTGWQGFQRTDALIAAIFASTLLGLLLFGAVNLLAITVFARWTAGKRKT